MTLVDSSTALSILGCSRGTLNKLVRDGQLTPAAIEGDTRTRVYWRDELEQLRDHRLGTTWVAQRERRAFASGLAYGLNMGQQCDCGATAEWAAVDEDNLVCTNCNVIVSVATLLPGSGRREA